MLLYIHDYAMIVVIHEHAYCESSVPSLRRYVYVTDSKSGLIIGLDLLIHCVFGYLCQKTFKYHSALLANLERRR